MEIINFIVALALGIFIGLEREYAKYKKRGHAFAGIRTFPLISLSGALAAYFAELVTSWILVVSVLIMGALVVVAYFSLSRSDRTHVGATSEV